MGFDIFNGIAPSEAPDGAAVVRDQGDGNYDHRSIVDVWDGRWVLCLDGGDTTSISSLLVLEVLVEEISRLEQKRTPSATTSSFSPLFQPLRRTSLEPNATFNEEQYRLCHYFDYICGTSIGGICAIMLGTMRLSVHETIERNKDIWHGITPGFASILKPLRLKPPRKQTTDFQTHLEVAFADYSGDQNEQSTTSKAFVASAPGMKHVSCQPCQTIIFAMQNASEGVTRPYVFRSHQSQFLGYLIRESGHEPAQVSVRDAARATSAAPMFSPEVAIPGVGGKFRDGGLWKSNPASEVYREVRDLHEDLGTPIDGLLSIGSAPKKEFHRRKDDSDDALRKRSKLENFKYDRLLTTKSLDLAALSDPASFDRFKDDILAECHKPEFYEKIRRWAEYLVTTRQLRSRTIQWESYADFRVQCSMCLPNSASFDRKTLATHFRETHRSDVKVLKAMAKKSHASARKK